MLINMLPNIQLNNRLIFELTGDNIFALHFKTTTASNNLSTPFRFNVQQTYRVGAKYRTNAIKCTINSA